MSGSAAGRLAWMGGWAAARPLWWAVESNGHSSVKRRDLMLMMLLSWPVPCTLCACSERRAVAEIRLAMLMYMYRATRDLFVRYYFPFFLHDATIFALFCALPLLRRRRREPTVAYGFRGTEIARQELSLYVVGDLVTPSRCAVQYIMVSLINYVYIYIYNVCIV